MSLDTRWVMSMSLDHNPEPSLDHNPAPSHPAEVPAAGGPQPNYCSFTFTKGVSHFGAPKGCALFAVDDLSFIKVCSSSDQQTLSYHVNNNFIINLHQSYFDFPIIKILFDTNERRPER